MFRIINLLNKPTTKYDIYKKLNYKRQVYNVIKKMEELFIIRSGDNVIYLDDTNNVFKLTEEGTFLVFFGNRIPIVLNCPYWNSCSLKYKYKICFGEPNCKLLERIMS